MTQKTFFNAGLLPDAVETPKPLVHGVARLLTFTDNGQGLTVEHKEKKLLVNVPNRFAAIMAASLLMDETTLSAEQELEAAKEKLAQAQFEWPKTEGSVSSANLQVVEGGMP